MRFQPGESGNPVGRPKGSYGGRIQALAALDRLVARKKNQAALTRALEAELLEDPVKFFKTVIMPLLPREAKLSVDHDGVIEWRSLAEVSREAYGNLEEPGRIGDGGGGSRGGAEGVRRLELPAGGASDAGCPGGRDEDASRLP